MENKIPVGKPDISWPGYPAGAVGKPDVSIFKCRKTRPLSADFDGLTGRKTRPNIHLAICPVGWRALFGARVAAVAASGATRCSLGRALYYSPPSGLVGADKWTRCGAQPQQVGNSDGRIGNTASVAPEIDEKTFVRCSRWLTQQLPDVSIAPAAKQGAGSGLAAHACGSFQAKPSRLFFTKNCTCEPSGRSAEMTTPNPGRALCIHHGLN